MHAAAQTAHSTCGAPVTRTFSPGGTALQGYANDFGASCLNSAAGSLLVLSLLLASWLPSRCCFFFGYNTAFES